MTQNLDRYKFRVWDEGSYNSPKEHMIYCSGFSIFDTSLLRLYDEYGREIKSSYPPIKRLMQSTGLKDKNGNLIFEGDIIKHKSGCLRDNEKYLLEYELFEVTWHNGAWIMSNHELEESPMLTSSEYGCVLPCVEVIGNIYENPLQKQNL